MTLLVHLRPALGFISGVGVADANNTRCLEGEDKHSLSSKKTSLMIMAASLPGGVKMNIRIAATGKEFTAATKLVMYLS